MLERINICFPHAVVFFEVCSDDIELLETLMVYYGSCINENEMPIAIRINYKCGVLSLPQNERYLEKRKVNSNVAVCNIITYIRDHICLEDEWYMFHASCSVIGKKTYLFVGHSSAGKSTLITFLHHQPYVITVSDDICIINYKTLEIVSIQRPFFLRQDSYQILTETYKLNLNWGGMRRYNLNEKIISCDNAIVPNIKLNVDEIIFLHLQKGQFEKCNYASAIKLLENSYNCIDIYKGFCASSMMLKRLPSYQMYYFDMNEVYSHLIK